ncbi:hypothetical protein [Hymenobacter lapidiphilus]|uniref:hypothetical protein n=1 Tax=Hymenobacter sp. CCM 8763 TaxID=2303334 RepID=UPI001F5BD0C8|nr:hypothetical protein [Hymenobacter sp. CCM 8763]
MPPDSASSALHQRLAAELARREAAATPPPPARSARTRPRRFQLERLPGSEPTPAGTGGGPGCGPTARGQHRLAPAHRQLGRR